MAKAVKLKLVPAGKGKYKHFKLFYKNIPLEGCSVYAKAGHTFDASFNTGEAQGLVVGTKKHGMLLRKEKDGMYLYVDGLTLEDGYKGLSKEQLANWKKNGSTRHWRDRFKSQYIVHDNGSAYFSGWYNVCHCRERAFERVVEHLNERVKSGIPTKKPYILYVKETGRLLNKNRVYEGPNDKRVWEVTTTIVRKK